MLLRALLPCILVASGGCVTIFDPDPVTYELQVRDLQDGAPVSGVALQVGHRDTETRSGQFTLDERTPALEHGIQERGASLCLCVSVANHVGKCTSGIVRCEVPLFGERDFIREGRRLRRMEAVTLQRKAP